MPEILFCIEVVRCKLAIESVVVMDLHVSRLHTSTNTAGTIPCAINRRSGTANHV